ncbi:hypothetical protein V4U86_22285 [Mycobacterium sp. AMU20-3851]|uniref:hypothetical protein n=1 Tax=Mycobacterium sp. AMU20-3851 TaxID=3122055 RepID=UPI003754587C
MTLRPTAMSVLSLVGGAAALPGGHAHMVRGTTSCTSRLGWSRALLGQLTSARAKAGPSLHYP